MEGPILLVPFPKGGLRPELAEGPSLSLCESGNIQDYGLCFTGSPARGQSSWSGACCPLEARWMAAGWGQTKGPGRLLASLTAEVAWDIPGCDRAWPLLIPAGQGPWWGPEFGPKAAGL